MNSSRRTKQVKRQQNSRIDWGVSLIVALFLCRLLVPTEAAEQGFTLWICSLTFVSAAMILFFKFRTQQSLTYRPALPDLAVCLMVLGHLVSGFYILTGTGNQRSALNMIWEWLSIGVFWVLVRLLLVRIDSRSVFATGFVITAIGLSLLGLWQHYVWYPQQAENFAILAEYKERLDANETLSGDEQAEFKQRLSEYGTDILTLDEPGRLALFSRVRESVEPIGLFVLANTFAMFVAIAFLLLLFDVTDRSSPQDKSTKVVLAAFVVSLLFCLVLTKSRTAWVGCTIGLATFYPLRWFLTRSSVRIKPHFFLVTVALFAGLLVWATLTGGLDVEVISEAPKSLQYRLEYWHSTIQLLQDRPLLGAGPGNFRQNYLQHKLPGSSEEILDPHNLFLGIWSGGGLLAMIGLCLLIASAFNAGIRHLSRSETDPKQVPATAIDLKTIAMPIVVAYLLTICSAYLLEGHLDQRLLLMGGVTWLLAFIWFRFGRPFSLTSLSAVAALVAALIHLLGASGIEMPAVVMLLLLLVHFTVPAHESPNSIYQLPQSSLFFGVAVSSGLLIGSLVTGLLPVKISQTDIQIGESMLLIRNNPQLAKRYFQNAIEADSLSPEPHQQLAMLYLSLWQQSGNRDESDFENAILHQENAIQLDPFAAGRYRILGNFWDQKSRVTSLPEDAAFAVAAYQQAAKRYPHFAETQAELAMAQVRANQDARPAAEKALKLDQLNRDNGHSDKYLSDDIRQKLIEISE